MIVYVVFDTLLERPVSVHTTQLGAEKSCVAYNEKNGRVEEEDDAMNWLEINDFELEG